jgi:hypothetical protein
MDPIHHQLRHDIVLGAARADVNVRQDHAAGEAGVHGRVREDIGELAEVEVVSRWPGSGMGHVPPVEAKNLSAREPLRKVGVRPPRAEPELDDDPLLAGQPPGREIDAVTLSDLLADVGVNSAHVLPQADGEPGRLGAGQHYSTATWASPPSPGGDEAAEANLS